MAELDLEHFQSDGPYKIHAHSSFQNINLQKIKNNTVRPAYWLGWQFMMLPEIQLMQKASLQIKQE